ncbi:hypothetical protein KGF56_003586 [Candida oxycetoniae]|uniref:Uncharacterized protein n=1 Tax=Candida oxycetoniae TaxID=497107 RepID=A0AAI9SVU0_9ASCO|nr:uncharacterized protein KGF56_003586 [Candida oxycetoniae]KAI3403659.2 hypothetical protein KGF56_003586 [Candida oxycetoniae]
MLKTRASLVIGRMFSYGHASQPSAPPSSYFSSPSDVPQTFGGYNNNSNNNNSSSSSNSNNNNNNNSNNSNNSSNSNNGYRQQLPQQQLSPYYLHSTTNSTPFQSSSSSQSQTHEGSLREITGLLAMFALAYIAIDNYTERMKLEKLHSDTTAINLKALQVQQLNYQKERKKRDLAILQERRELAKRSFKMGLHIAMLRKQLIDAGLDPVSMDQAVAEFEKSVKADNSIKNVTGQYLWLDDKSDYKQHLPDSVEYDKARKSD